MYASYPTSLPSGGPDATIIVALFLLGFAVTGFGRIISSTMVTAIGVTMIFAATIVVPLVYFAFR